MTRPALLVIGLCVLLAAGAAGMYLSDSSSQPTGLAPSVHQIAAEAKRAVEAKAFADCLRLTRRVADDQPGAAEVRLWEGIAL